MENYGKIRGFTYPSSLKKGKGEPLQNLFLLKLLSSAVLHYSISLLHERPSSFVDELKPHNLFINVFFLLPTGPNIINFF